VSYTVRPISEWPQGMPEHPTHSPFKANYSQSEDLLLRELAHLNAKNVVLEIDVRSQDLRLDGTLRANAKSQGRRVVLYADTVHGPLMMPCGTYTSWQDNIRAIALSLEALRKVDRYGCSVRGEQYRGWTAIPASTSMTTKVEAAWRLLIDIATGEPDYEMAREHRTRANLDLYYREAAKVAHPDVGGTEERMAAVNRARETILIDLGGRDG
jgi:hypothetical protein